MARRIRNANPVTLFPFLAVLMCTIGALVLLLVVISAQIRGSAVQQFVAEQQQKAPIEPSQSVVEEPPAVQQAEPTVAESVIVVVAPERVQPPDPPVARIPPPIPASDEQLATIDSLKSKAVALQEKFADTAEELNGLTQKRGVLSRQLQTVAAQETDLQKTLQQSLAVSTAAERQLTSLNVENRQIIELLEQSDELIKSERKRVSTPRHSLIPYDGQTGTIRKPIVIECAKGTIRFEAEDVALDTKRLEEYPPGVNPLVAGIQTLFAYWTEQARTAGRTGAEARPYALLIVRPTGADQFRLARMLLQPLVGDYGYEFVEESFAYDVPTTTDDAARKCREAVEAAFQMRPRGPGVGPVEFAPGTGSGGNGNRPNGGIVLPRGPIDVERLTQRPAASRGFFSSGNFRRRLIGESVRGTAEGGFAAGGSAEPGGSGATAPQGPGSQETKHSQGTKQTRASATVAQSTSLPQSTAEPNGEPGLRSEGGTSQTYDGTSQQSSNNGETGGSRTGNPQAGPQQSNGKVTLEPALRDDTPNTRREAQSTVAEFLAKAKAIREQQQQTSDSARGGGPGTVAAPSNARAGVRAADSAAGRGSGSNSTTEAGTAEDGASAIGATGNSSGGEAAASGPSSPSVSRTLKQNERNGVVQKRWGQSDPTASLGLERPVTIVVGKSRVLIVGAYQITLRQEWSELQAVNLCLKGLDMTASDWGQPGERFYWVPVVTLRVEDGGESLGRLLEASLERLGVMVEREPTFLESGRRD